LAQAFGLSTGVQDKPFRLLYTFLLVLPTYNDLVLPSLRVSISRVLRL